MLLRPPFRTPPSRRPSSPGPWAAAWLLLPALAGAQANAPADSPAPEPSERVTVTGRHYDNAVGSSDAASEGRIRAELLKSRPALRPGEVLEFVPGVIVTQHSGDGKANQYFLRGFNLDHGTDFATTVNGLPVNMPSHGHGQGYSDLNFLIPELVDHITYRKGPYFAGQGDFSSAGAADIAYKTQLDHAFGQLTLGENAYRRAVLAGSVALQPDTQLLAALEWMGNDGPWAVPEDLRRRNAVLTLSQGSRQRGWSASLMGYDGRWTATDQVPLALIEAGTLNGRPFGRFDSLDDSAGGFTRRHSLSAEWHDRGETEERQVSAYVLSYRLGLFSNFTYALERPATGDQFSQQDRRTVFGLAARQTWAHTLGPWAARSEAGLQWRHDDARVGLFHTERRVVFDTVRDDDVRQDLLGLYGQSSVALGPRWRAVLGLRADHIRNRVDSRTAVDYGGRAQATQLSPKLSLVAGPWQHTEWFINWGRGLHSNDARGSTDPSAPVPPLVASRGWELGLRTEALPGLQSSLAFWRLHFDSELVYVGDAGVTEASGASSRRGIEWNNRWTPTRHLLVDADLAWTHARFDNGDRIPNAVDRVASVAGTLRELGPWSASLQWRYLGSAALVEDNSVRSTPSSTFNLRISRDLKGWLGRPSSLTLDVFNLTDRRVDDIQYVYAYQLPGQAAAEGKVVHPAEPRSLRLTWQMGF